MSVVDAQGDGRSDWRGRARQALEALSSQPGGVALVGALLLVPLALNPGWFSHDELQWAAFARPLDGVPIAAGWLEVERFQYRPLTFELWLKEPLDNCAWYDDGRFRNESPPCLSS
jgi:hypothetical protein